MKHVKLDDLLLDPDKYDLEEITHSVRAEVLKAYDRSIEKFDRAWAKRHPKEKGTAATLVITTLLYVGCTMPTVPVIARVLRCENNYVPG